jgi:hypothetical protein
MRTIRISRWFTFKNSEGGDDILAYGLDGVLYSLETSPEGKQEDYADWLSRRGNRTFEIALNIGL